MRKAIIAAVFIILVGSTPAFAYHVDECGVLDKAVEGCYTFQEVHDGRFYELPMGTDLFGFGEGDTVQIIGEFIPGLSICMSGGLPHLYPDTMYYCGWQPWETQGVPMSSAETIGIICLILLAMGVLVIRKYRTAR